MAMTDAQLAAALLSSMRDTYTINYSTGSTDAAFARQERTIARVERDATPDQYSRFIGAASSYRPGSPQLVIGDRGGRDPRPARPTAADAEALWAANRLEDAAPARGAASAGAAGTGDS